MPWWIWLILSLFMLAMIVAGIAYAALHGFRAFTQPLNSTISRYDDAQFDVIRRRNAKRERHARAWARWSRFNR